MVMINITLWNSISCLSSFITTIVIIVAVVIFILLSLPFDPPSTSQPSTMHYICNHSKYKHPKYKSTNIPVKWSWLLLSVSTTDNSMETGKTQQANTFINRIDVFMQYSTAAVVDCGSIFVIIIFFYFHFWFLLYA